MMDKRTIHFDEVLSDLEIEKVSEFVSDDLMREAVKTMLLFGVYSSGTLKKTRKNNVFDPMLNVALYPVMTGETIAGRPWTDKEIADYERAYGQAVQMVDSAFNKMAVYKKTTIPNRDLTENPAR